MSVRIFDSSEALGAAAAADIAAQLNRAISARGRAALGLSGGTSSIAVHRALAAGSFPVPVDWTRVYVWFADERAVPPLDPESNFRLARETLIDPVGIPPTHVHRMRAEHVEHLEAVALEYEARFPPALDVLILGIGPDGHTASIFPGSSLVNERTRRVVVVTNSPKPPPQRVTVTPRVLEEARSVAVIATGSTKADAVARALEGDVTPLEVPARLVRDRDWYLDRAAAERLARASHPG
jgi:6-phosphogluconolactonase